MKYAVLFLFFLTSIAIHSQEAECGFYGKKTVEQRNQLFPFNKAERVLLISYADYEFPSADDTIPEPAKGINKWVI